MSAKGYAAIPTAVLYDPELSTDAKMVYLVLSSHVGADATAWPSHSVIAGIAGVSVATVKRRLKELRDRGLVEWETRIGTGRMKQSNEYRIIAGSAPVPAMADSSHRPQGHTDPRVTQTRPDLQIAHPEHGVTVSERTKDLKDKESTTPEAPPREDVERICAHLADRIQGNNENGKRPTITEGWRSSARLMLDADSRTEAQVHKAIDWCQSDEFWRGNIRSMPKLRAQYETLRHRASLEAKRNAAPLPVDFAQRRRAAAESTVTAAWMS